MSKWTVRDGRARRIPPGGRDVPRGGPAIPRRTAKWLPPAPDDDADVVEDESEDA